MKKNANKASLQCGMPEKRMPGALGLAIAAMLGSSAAGAMELDVGNPDVKARWDNTVKYSAAARVKDRSPALLRDSNLDDGDRNFSKGLISNRVDLLSEFDVTYQNFGARLSGAAWYDSVYNGKTDNDSPGTYNPRSVSNTEFAPGTRDLHGRKAELLDAFLFAKGELGDMPGSARLGRHALLYGESLFFGNNGIAGTMAPVDIVKQLSVPGSQFKEIVRPVGQVSGQLQIKSNLLVGGYYQYQWERSLLPGSGSYFSSTADFMDAGGESLFAGPPGTPPDLRTADQKARNSGQGGLQVRWTPQGSGVDLGFYATRYHDKGPQVVISPATSTYHLAYHENVKAFGASFSTTIGEVNLAGEASVRRNTALVNAGVADLFGVVPVFAGGPAAPSNNNANPIYPIGNSAHVQVSTLTTLPPNFIARESSLMGEVAWNRVTSVTKNAAALDPDATRDAWGLRAIFKPSYRQALPAVDLSVPIGISYFPKGKSSVVTNFGPDKGGDISIGVEGTYLATWNFSLNYTHFYGPENVFTVPVALGSSQQKLTYQQVLKDRDFISLSVSHTF